MNFVLRRPLVGGLKRMLRLPDLVWGRWQPLLRKSCANLLFLSLTSGMGALQAQELRPTRNGMDLSTEWKQLMEELRNAPVAEQLTRVNTFFNRRISYERGVTTREPNQGWMTPSTFLKAGTGDCKEFAMAKYFTLQMMGVPTEHLRLMYVQAKVGGEIVPHLVLAYYGNNPDDPIVLDNLILSLRPISRRIDLAAEFTFNEEGLWSGKSGRPIDDPLTRISRWKDVVQRNQQEFAEEKPRDTPTSTVKVIEFDDLTGG